VASSAISDVVRDLRVFARADDPEDDLRLVDANELVDQALRLTWKDLSEIANIERDYDREIPRLVVSPNRLVQVVINVLINAASAMRDVERSVHRLRISTRADAEYVAISISDTGPGIAPEGIEHIFDPFFTTKRAGLGTGLGLSISRSIMVELGGDLVVESVHGSGATFIALVPIPDPESIREAVRRGARSPILAASTRRSSVLLVDDDERVLRACSRFLGRSCNVITASDGQEAIDLLSSGSSAEAVFTELTLPDVDGRAFFQWLKQHRPELAQRTVFMSADSTQERYAAFLRDEGLQVLTKPVRAATLMEALEQVLARGR